MEDNDGYPQYRNPTIPDATPTHQCASNVQTAITTDYLNMIGELKNELDTLSNQVTDMLKDDLAEIEDSSPDDISLPEMGIVMSPTLSETLKSNGFPDEREHVVQGDDGNDELKDFTEIRQKTPTSLECRDICRQLQHKNQQLLSQIHFLQNANEEKNSYIMKLNSMEQKEKECQNELKEMREEIDKVKSKNSRLLDDLGRAREQEKFNLHEIEKLNAELTESKRKCSNLLAQSHRMSSILKAEELERKELVEKYSALEKNCMDQKRSVRNMQETIANMTQIFENQSSEMVSMKKELYDAREKEAALVKHQRNLCEQLFKTETELLNARKLLKDKDSLMQEQNRLHSENVKEMQNTHEEVKLRLNEILQEFKDLQNKYQKSIEVSNRKDACIETYKKWRETQLKSDADIKHTVSQYVDHINVLLEEKARVTELYRNLQQEYALLQNELERLKCYGSSTSSYRHPAQTLDETLVNTNHVLRQTTQRLANQSKLIMDGSGGSEVGTT